MVETSLASKTVQAHHSLPGRALAAVSFRSRAAAARGVRWYRSRFVRLETSEIVRALRQFDRAPRRGLMVHSALSGCGKVVGGAPAVEQALDEWLGGECLAMPTHSYCYPDSEGEAPVFDPARTRSAVGAVTDHFWRQPGVIRSLHPTHSLAIRGSEAAELCRDHEECETPCGRGTPYERLVARDAAVLMFGARMDSYTLYHTAEDAAEVPYLYEPAPYRLRILRQDGSMRTVTVRRQDMNVRRAFLPAGEWLEAQGLLQRARLGWGELLYVPSTAAAHEALVRQMRRDPCFLVHPEARESVAARSARRS